jgi:hypothetical protein
MMMTAGFWIFGLVFCLLGTVLLVALGFLALRHFVSERPRDDTWSRLAAHDVVGVGPRAEA